MEVVLTGPDGREHPLTRQPLELHYDRERDLFHAIAEAHHALAEDPLADALHERTLRFLIAADGEVVGFQVLGFSRFEPEAGNIDLLYTPSFRAVQLGASPLSTGEIIERIRADEGFGQAAPSLRFHAPVGSRP